MFVVGKIYCQGWILWMRLRIVPIQFFSSLADFIRIQHDLLAQKVQPLVQEEYDALFKHDLPFQNANRSTL